MPVVMRSSTEKEAAASAGANPAGSAGRSVALPAEARLRELGRKLAQLMRTPALTSGEIAGALSALTELAAELLSAGRASVWQLSADGATLECVDLYEQEQPNHSRGTQLLVSCYPGYFSALLDDRVLAAANARQDPRTREFEETYLAPLGIEAKLDAPVVLRGRIVGVVAIEHLGAPRVWQFWEELVAGTLADFVALVLQAREQLRVEAQLKEQRARVDELLETRTNQVVRENADLQRAVDTLQLDAETSRRSEDDLRRLFAASPVPMLLVHKLDGRVLLANEKCASALRCTLEEASAMQAAELFVQPGAFQDLLDMIGRGGTEDSREVELKARDGERFYALLSARDVAFSGDETVMLGFTDLTAQKAVEHQLRYLAQRDPLTQAYNRHHFWALANAEMARVRRYKRPLSIAMIDADHFKAVNDVHGHDVGDLVLRMIVDTCHDSLRKNDVLARYGGEEFVVLLPETPLAGAVVVMERVRERIEATTLELEQGQRISITVSVGLADSTSDAEDIEGLLKRADDALYAAKHAGRNRVHVAEASV
jgi:diguanylate cyclase (GGDEF)-like protein/PAS domain S-box-containing protein